MMLKHRVFCKALPKTFNLSDHSLDDLDENLRQKVIDTDIRRMIISRRNKVIGQLKFDMMAIYISAAEATARGHAKLAQEEKDKLLSRKNVAMTVDNVDAVAMINNMINAIQARQENIIKRAQYVTNCKVYFFDETPTTSIE
jgi:hypothetical protein